jgi:hypothetical protein
MAPKTILSLFDESGEWTAPFAEAGHMFEARREAEEAA